MCKCETYIYKLCVYIIDVLFQKLNLSTFFVEAKEMQAVCCSPISTASAAAAAATIDKTNLDEVARFALATCRS